MGLSEAYTWDKYFRCVLLHSCTAHMYQLNTFMLFRMPCHKSAHADVSAALVHTVGLIAAHTVHTIQTSQQQRIIRY